MGICIIDASNGFDSNVPTVKAILSDKVTKHDLLKDFDSPFDYSIDLLLKHSFFKGIHIILLDQKGLNMVRIYVGRNVNR